MLKDNKKLVSLIMKVILFVMGTCFIFFEDVLIKTDGFKIMGKVVGIYVYIFLSRDYFKGEGLEFEDKNIIQKYYELEYLKKGAGEDSDGEVSDKKSQEAQVGSFFLMVFIFLLVTPIVVVFSENIDINMNLPLLDNQIFVQFLPFIIIFIYNYIKFLRFYIKYNRDGMDYK